MIQSDPMVFVLGYTVMDYQQASWYLDPIQVHSSADIPPYQRKLQDQKEINGTTPTSGEDLIEFAGRVCYNSFAPGVNPNVTKIREDQEEYIENILVSRHGSVLEHVSMTFGIIGVSRVFTHELVRHRVGTAISQESMRYVRLTDLPFFIPPSIQRKPELVARFIKILNRTWDDYKELEEALMPNNGEGLSFKEKKELTSTLRRVLPNGVTTSIVWTANLRTLRHVIELRTSPAAEEEIRDVFYQIGCMAAHYYPSVFQDMKMNAEVSPPQWVFENPRV